MMSYPEAPDSGDLRGVPDIHHPRDGHNNPGVLDLQSRLSSMELASNGESANQVHMP